MQPQKTAPPERTGPPTTAGPADSAAPARRTSAPAGQAAAPAGQAAAPAGQTAAPAGQAAAPAGQTAAPAGQTAAPAAGRSAPREGKNPVATPAAQPPAAPAKKGAGPVRAADRLDRARIVETAIELLDKVGLDGLSLRRLAAELGVQAPALYWHVTNKQELLDLMVETLVSREAPARPLQPGEAWDEWVAERFRDMRRMLNRHRDGAMLTASTHPADSQWPGVEMILATLVDLGLEPADGMRAMIAAGNYVSGFTLEEQADRMRGHSFERTTPEDWDQAMVALAPYPLMTAAFRVIGDPQSDPSFEAGLQLILDGLRKRVAEAQRRRAG